MDFIRYLIRTLDWKFATAIVAILVGLVVAISYANVRIIGTGRLKDPHPNDRFYATEEEERIRQRVRGDRPAPVQAPADTRSNSGPAR